MINANELRIGNKVLHPKDNSIIFTIDREDFAVTNGLANLEDFRPIPLTEEWLLRLGFEKQNEYVNEVYSLTQDDEFKSEFVVLYEKEFKRCKVSFTGFWYGIYDVHQLQNLYFALTQEELCLKN